MDEEIYLFGTCDSFLIQIHVSRSPLNITEITVLTFVNEQIPRLAILNGLLRDLRPPSHLLLLLVSLLAPIHLRLGTNRVLGNACVS